MDSENSMIPSPLPPIQSIRRTLLACICTLALFGCSSSSDSGTSDVQAPADVQPPTESQAPSSLTTTRITFDITVPAYLSDELQVKLNWGEIETTAAWVEGVSWVASESFPSNTENLLVVTFYDRNGSIALATVEKAFRTGSDATASVQITADQFDTERWDSDGDGVSNLDELIAGGNPDGSVPLQPVQASLELVPDKTFRISWQLVEGVQFYRVLENPDGVSGFSQISADLDPVTQTFNHRVALYLRLGARYMVQACSSAGCSDSDELLVSGTLENAIGYIQSSNIEAGDFFGARVSMSADGNTLAISALTERGSATGVNGNQDDNSAQDAGAVYVFERISDNWQQQAYLKASNTDANDRFGESISLSSDGETLAVGAYWEDSTATGINGDQNDNSAQNAGAVYVFARSNGSWQQQAYLKDSITGPAQQFGDEVSLNADGNTLAVAGSGLVYVFVRDNGSWLQQASLGPSNPMITGFFGRSLSLSGVGNTLAVGATDLSTAIGINGDAQPTNERIDGGGAVHVFERVNGNWELQAYVKASNAEARDAFGSAVSLSTNGSTLAVGAPRERSMATGVNGDQDDNSYSASGAVYVFERSDASWQQQAYLKASSVGHNRFGTVVSLSGDSNTVAITAAGDSSAATGINGDPNDDTYEAAGAVYLFTRNEGLWQLQAYVKPPSNYDLAFFGGRGTNGGSSAISLSENGETLAIGTSPSVLGEAPLSFQAVYLY